MRFTTEAQLLAHVNVGDTIYYTGLFKDRPLGVIEVPVRRISSNIEEYPTLYINDHASGGQVLIITHHEAPGSRYGRNEYVETMLMTNRVCTTTRMEAEQGLRALTWLYDNDAEERDRIRREWYYRDRVTR